MHSTETESRGTSLKQAHAAGGRCSVHPNVILAICCMSLLLVGMDR